MPSTWPFWHALCSLPATQKACQQQTWTKHWWHSACGVVWEWDPTKTSLWRRSSLLSWGVRLASIFHGLVSVRVLHDRVLCLVPFCQVLGFFWKDVCILFLLFLVSFLTFLLFLLLLHCFFAIVVYTCGPLFFLQELASISQKVKLHACGLVILVCDREGSA